MSVKIKAKKHSKYRAPRVKYIYDPKDSKPFKVSRSKLDLFLRCARCFYLDRKLGIGQPPGYPFLLNQAVDELLKKEFNTYREQEMPHPLCIENDINAIPLKHEDIDDWRDPLHKGVQYLVPGTNLILQGGLDDVWINPKTNELIVVDYKATSKLEQVTLDADWQIGYKRQVEVYQWLLRKKGFAVSNIAYFVYCNGKKDLDRFDKQLIFDISVLSYDGDDSWVGEAVLNTYKCLQSETIPPFSESCDYCLYLKAAQKYSSE